MLDEFNNNKFYEYAKNLKNYYHAYVFEVDDINNSFKIILAFAKMLICKNHYTNNLNCGECNICNLIDKNYYSDLKLVEPDGMSIKKEQILKVQKDLSLKSSNNTNQIYIIKEADKMNLNASNSLLKFLEEPSEGIYAFLITTDKNKLLSTILSRCNLISLKTERDSYLQDEIEILIEFIKTIFKEKEKTLAYLKEKYFKYYKTRDEIIKSFNTMEVILDIAINLRYQINNNFPFCDIIDTSLKEISTNDLLFYLEKIVFFKDKLSKNINLNINLFMDCFIIEISKVVLL